MCRGFGRIQQISSMIGDIPTTHYLSVDATPPSLNVIEAECPRCHGVGFTGLKSNDVFETRQSIAGPQVVTRGWGAQEFANWISDVMEGAWDNT
jgi:hypothetical protein